MTRGTARKAINVQAPTFFRLEAYLKECEGSRSKSGFLEALLVEAHPEVFGEGAPPPPEPTEEEKALTRERQTEARKRVDRRNASKFFPGLVVSKPTRKTKKAPELVQVQDPGPGPGPGKEQPLAHLQPKPEPAHEKPDDQEDFPTGVVMF